MTSRLLHIDLGGVVRLSVRLLPRSVRRHDYLYESATLGPSWCHMQTEHSIPALFAGTVTSTQFGIQLALRFEVKQSVSVSTEVRRSFRWSAAGLDDSILWGGSQNFRTKCQ